MAVKVVLQSNLDQVPNWGNELDPQRDTLIVPDLKSKLEVQADLLLRVPVLESTAVLRASEFWRALLLKTAPDMKVVSIPTLRVFIAQFLRDEYEQWQINSAEADLVLRYVEQLLPFLSHPRGDAVLQEWLESQPMSMIRWGRWYHLSKAVWTHLAELKVLAPRWVPAFLSNQTQVEEFWPRRLIFDLGPQLSGSEAELILQLGGHQEVEVLRPHPTFASRYYGTLWAYDLLTEGNERKRIQAGVVDGLEGLKVGSGFQWRRHSTMLAEVKDVAAQLRLWLDQGAPLSEIAVCAPDVEVYWPALKSYLDVEGIPVLKSKVVSWAQLPEISTWLTVMRVKLGSFGSEDLEAFLFSTRNKSPISHSEFRRLYRLLYDRSDIERSPEVSHLIETEMNPENRVRRDEFLNWAVSLWPNGESGEGLERVVKTFLAEGSPASTMSFDHWLLLLEPVALRSERTVEDSPREGVHLVNLESLDHLKVKRVYVIGVCDETLRRSVGTAITLKEVVDISRNTGFHLSEPESSDREFMLRWLFTRSWQEVVVSYPVTDFAGEILAPSRLWVEGRIGAGDSVESVDPPRVSRWDELQSLPLAELARERELPRKDLQEEWIEGLEIDLGLRPQKNYPIEGPLSLSVSQWESFKKCPFVFAAKKVFHLSDTPDLDLDPDAMGKGSLLHGWAEELTKEPFRADWTEDELASLIDGVKDRVGLILGEPRFWPVLRRVHVRMAKGFLQNEIEWRKSHPKGLTRARELDVRAYWSREKREFTREPTDVTFRGRIDRVDSDGQGNYAVIDYKSSKNDVRNFGGWLESDKYQLPVYSHLIEEGFGELETGPVVAALYYVMRDFDRSLGLVCDEADPEFVSVKEKSKSRISRADQEKLYSEVILRLGEFVEQVIAGGFQPEPRDRNLCGTCRWRKLCRAPHLI